MVCYLHIKHKKYLQTGAFTIGVLYSNIAVSFAIDIYHNTLQ